MQTEFDFQLPRGYVDAAGVVHRDGRMRLATARDEIQSAEDPRVRANTVYLPVVLLSRVVVRLGALPAITPQVIEGLFAADLAFLEDLYLRLNGLESIVLNAVCPQCNAQFQVKVAPLAGD
ncbi:MAG: phage tail assembly protein [Chloroflexi bacterium]|nr:phage tail assembly protein [Chloroflexota bacterium]